jgi:hypothetical protein
MRANDSVADPILNLKGPHPEEPAIAGVSKDGQGPQRMGPSFETRPADAPQDEVSDGLTALRTDAAKAHSRTT